MTQHRRSLRRAETIETLFEVCHPLSPRYIAFGLKARDAHHGHLPPPEAMQGTILNFMVVHANDQQLKSNSNPERTEIRPEERSSRQRRKTQLKHQIMQTGSPTVEHDQAAHASPTSQLERRFRDLRVKSQASVAAAIITPTAATSAPGLGRDTGRNSCSDGSASDSASPARTAASVEY